MNILVLNCGSSSFKYQLIEMTTKRVMCSGLVERIGDAMGSAAHKVAPGTDKEKKYTAEQPFPDHTAGMEFVMKLLTDAEKGVIKSLKEIAAVGHRVVQGGEQFSTSCQIGTAECSGIEENIPLAPLHNPANLQGIQVAEKLLPHAPSVAVFDTEFHTTMPQKAYMYPLPYEVYEKQRVRRYGFHGTSHKYVTGAAAAFLKKPVDSFNVITCHLGNGCSITAVKNGKSIDTSMGMTPLAGVMMGTRCGDIDPDIHKFLGDHLNLDLKGISNLLNKQSGLKGICGMNDMRDLHEARAKGDKKAQLAFEMFCYSIKKYVGAYYAVLGRVDAIVFTAGIGENDDDVRAEVCAELNHMGIELDLAKNKGRKGDICHVGKDGSKVAVLVVPTNEELAIAEATQKVLQK